MNKRCTSRSFERKPATEMPSDDLKYGVILALAEINDSAQYVMQLLERDGYRIVRDDVRALSK